MAEKAKTAGTLGIVAGSSPAQMLMAADSDNRFVKTYMTLNPHLLGLAHALKGADALGRRLDAAQFERGADAAALVEQVAMLPLDMIGVGEVAHASMAALRATTRVAAKAARAVVPKVVREGVHEAATAVGSRLHKMAQPVVDKAVHKVIARFGDDIHGRAMAWAERHGFEACFPANTMMVGEFGLKPIEQHRSFEEFGDDCDRVYSRNEHDPDGPLVLRRVLRRFERLSSILNLHVEGKLIGTTAEHPFFVRDRGWTPAQELRRGDEIRLMDDGWARVDGIADSGRIETVYNLEIEGDHTYFVGGDTWGWAVWAHNASCKGGAHEHTAKPSKDGLDSHHMPAKSIIPLDPPKGPAIKMDPLDHQDTSSYGNGLAAQLYRSHIKTLLDRGRWREAMTIEIRDVRRAAQNVSGDATKYNEHMQEMLVYAKNLGLLNK